MKPLPSIAAALLLAGVVAGRRRLTRGQRAALLLAAVVCAVSGSGLVHLPSLEHVAREATSALGPYTYVLVGVMAFLETGAGIGLVAPGELVVILGGVAAAQGEVRLIPLISLVWLCAVGGDLVSFLVGRRLGRGFLLAHGHRIGLTHARVAQVERYIAGHGGKTIVLGRFVGVVRALAPAIAGATRMPVRRFLPAAVVGAGLWASGCTVLGYVFWNSVDDALGLVRGGSLALGAAAAVAVAVVLIVRRRRPRGSGAAARTS